jgi:hypothetical protein
MMRVFTGASVIAGRPVGEGGRLREDVIALRQNHAEKQDN